MSRTRPTPTAIVGAGRLARALAPLLDVRGFPIVAVCARRAAPARSLARRLAAAQATTNPAVAAQAARLVLLAVPDRAIGAVARSLARERTLVWSGRTVLHHAGSRGIEPLAPLARAGAAVGVLHPLQCLARAEFGSRALPGSGARIEGDTAARALARQVARALGLVPLRLRRPAGPRDRIAYHAAASLLSNDLVALLALGIDLLVEAGAGRAAARNALITLARGTLLQAQDRGPEGALTGPATRGDLETLAAHLRRLASSDRDASEIHRLLSIRLARLAARGRNAAPALALEQALRDLAPGSRAGRREGRGL